MPKFSDMLRDSKPVINGRADITPDIGYEFGLIMGYLLFKLGGTADLPKKSELRAFLEEKFVMDNEKHDDGTATIRLIPVGGGSSLAN